MIFNKLICFFNNNNSQHTNSDSDNLKYELIKTKETLDLALHNLDYVIDPDLIDCCIYEVQAAQLRYKFLLREVKRTEAITVTSPIASIATIGTME